MIGGNHPANAVHIPPPPDSIPVLMEDLWQFATRNDMDIITHAAILHSQYEAIHPFEDGNGRTGRALITGLLGKDSTAYVVPVSSGLFYKRSSYYQMLRDYGNGDWISAIQQTADAVISACRFANKLAETATEKYEQLAERLSDPSELERTALKQICEAGCFTLSWLVERSGLDAETLRGILKPLEADGLIVHVHNASDASQPAEPIWAVREMPAELAWNEIFRSRS